MRKTAANRHPWKDISLYFSDIKKKKNPAH